jgi:hypothetical protein
MKKKAEQGSTSQSQSQSRSQVLTPQAMSQAAPEDRAEGMSQDTETSGTSEADADAPMEGGEDILDSAS